MKKDIIGWWSGGVTSAVACKLAINIFGKDRVRMIMIDTKNEHEDTYRFKDDCEEWYGLPIEVITGIGEEYNDISDVWRKYKSLNTATGAICSTQLKRLVRERWEKDNADFTHQIFGFEFDRKEFNRALGMTTNHGKRVKPIYPLLMYGYSKSDCLTVIQDAGIEVPVMYKMGFQNNNPCDLDTEIITFKGVKKIGDLLHTQQVLLNRQGWVFADIKPMGVQPIIELKCHRKGLDDITLNFTPDHKWWGVRRNRHYMKGSVETASLLIGDFLPFNTVKTINLKLDKEYFLRGVVVGDGSFNGKSSMVRLFGEKILMMQEMGYQVNVKSGVGFIYSIPLEYKHLPDLPALNYNEKCSFIAGLIATDGSVNISGQSCISTSDNLEYFVELLKSVGVLPTSIVNNTNNITNFNNKGVEIKATKTNWIINFRVPLQLLFRKSHIANYKERVNNLSGWEIVSMKKIGEKDVACATILNSDPEFTLSSGVLTGNCFGTGCTQGGIGYWQKIQRDFPDKFNAMADMEHELTELRGEPVTMLKDQSNEAKKAILTDKKANLVFLKKHKDYPNHKCIADMKPQKVEPLFDCNGMCGVNDMNDRSATEKEINYEQIKLFKE